jgi:D-amino peptidase
MHHGIRFTPGRSLWAVLFTALIGSACEPPAEDQSPTDRAFTGAPWAIEDAQVNTDDGIRILVLHDMEGLSGQDDPKTFDFGNEEYALGQDLLVGDVNAVIDGLFAGGATEVHVVDGHGSGNRDPDIPPDRLDERAEQVVRDEWFDAYFDLVEPGAYDAVAVVAMHAKTGSGGFASHTYTLGMDFVLNGESITETELVALSWGRVDVPLVFASGDDRLARDLEDMTWIEYVTVKEATSANTAIPRPLEDARADLRAAAQRAAENLGQAKVMKITTPVTATLRVVPPASLEMLDEFPGVDYADNSVTFDAADLADAYDGLGAIIRVATMGYTSVLAEVIRARPDVAGIRAAYNEALMARWFDVESGRWQPEEESPPPPRKYYGF